MSKKFAQKNRRTEEANKIANEYLNSSAFWQSVLKPKPKYVPGIIWKFLLKQVFK